MQLIQVPSSIINSIEKRCNPETGLIELIPVPVRVGDKVKVFDGPFAGIEGIFRQRKGKDRALLLMSILGTESTVEVEALLLQKAI
jgi:transcriptional antiterminator RfaH